MDTPERWSGVFTDDNAQHVAALLDAVLRQRYTCVTIVKDINWINVSTSRTGEVEKNGRVATLADGGAQPSGCIHWSIDSYFYSIHVDPANPVYIVWDGLCLTIRHNATAGHPLVWIFAPERGEDE